MDAPGELRCPAPTGLVRPVPIDPTGGKGPTAGQARGPTWRRSSPRLYVPSAVDRGRVEQRILEESMRLSAGGAVTGWAALRLAGAGFRRGAGFTVRRERVAPREVTVFHGIPCTVPLRAVFDEVRRWADLRERVVVIDMAAAAGLIRLPDLAAFVAAKATWPHVRRVSGCSMPRCLHPSATGRLRTPTAHSSGSRTSCATSLRSSASSTALSTARGAAIGSTSGGRTASDVLGSSASTWLARISGTCLSWSPECAQQWNAPVSAGMPRTWRIKRDPGPL
jgi:hypothetical protein